MSTIPLLSRDWITAESRATGNSKEEGEIGMGERRMRRMRMSRVKRMERIIVQMWAVQHNSSIHGVNHLSEFYLTFLD